VALNVVVWDRTDTFLPVAEGPASSRPGASTNVRTRGRDGRPDGTMRGRFGLSPWWRLGGGLHGLSRRLEGVLYAGRGVASWTEALEHAIEQADARGVPIVDFQAWGHGGWGFMDLGRTRLDRVALSGRSPLARVLGAFRERLAPNACVWLRCCSAFGSTQGRAFARELATRLGVRVAGHTYVIGAIQSGTHSLLPGETPSWPLEEGVVVRDGVHAGAKSSGPREPNTIGCLRLSLPSGW
jgi:hypothetical protein